MKARALVAWNLRRLRVTRDIAADRFAFEARVDRAYLGKIERQQANPTIAVLERIAAALGVPMTELFNIPPKGAPKPQPLKAGRKAPKGRKKAVK